MGYRQDIDGLRAIAVLSVIAYHFGFAELQGGFAGVDVFFVISGFLIGGIILRERRAGRFSFRNFYARRARRILPALIFVVMATALAGYMIQLPDEYARLGIGAIAALFFFSNIWFFKTIDYFNPAAANDPLVHTWSLGIEEQFYLIVPMLICALWRFGERRALLALAAIGLLSFGAAIATSADKPMAAFYLLHTRAWELLVGVGVAYLYESGAWRARRANLLSALGVALVLFGIWATPHGAPWPGFWTLPPVMGAALALLYGREPSLTHRILTLAPLRAVGLVSYSAYLWHQPVYAYAHAIAFDLPDATVAALASCLTLALSVLSWRFVEQPFRSHRLGARVSIGTLGLSAAAILAFGVGARATEGYPGRLPDEVRRVADYVESFSPTYRRCLIGRSDVADYQPMDACLFGVAGGEEVILWGDSHAAVIAQPLGEALARHGVALRQMTLRSCVPTPGLYNRGQNNALHCAEFNKKILDFIRNRSSVSTVVLHGAWSQYFDHRPSRNMLGVDLPDDFYSYPVSGPDDLDDVGRLAAIEAALVELATMLTDAGKRLVIVHSMPRPDIDVPRRAGRQALISGEAPDRVTYPREIRERQLETERAIFRKLVVDIGAPDVLLIDPGDALCDAQVCMVVDGGAPMFVDGHHLSVPGGERIVPQLRDVVLKPMPSGD